MISLFLIAAISASPPPVHRGTSPADAIVINASSDSDGVRAEYRYIASQTCGQHGAWKVTSQTLLTANRRPYDKLDATCTEGNAKRSFFFDITLFFGKF